MWAARMEHYCGIGQWEQNSKIVYTDFSHLSFLGGFFNTVSHAGGLGGFPAPHASCSGALLSPMLIDADLRLRSDGWRVTDCAVTVL